MPIIPGVIFFLRGVSAEASSVPRSADRQPSGLLTTVKKGPGAMPCIRGPTAVKRTAHADALGSLAVFLGMMKWTAAVVAAALATLAAVYTLLVLGSREGVRHYYG